MQILPLKELSSFIKHYLFLDSLGKEAKKLRLFSDGNTGLVFSLKNRLISGYDNYKVMSYLPDSFVYGQISEFKDIFTVGEISIVIVVFQPQGLNHLLGIPAGELRDNIVRTEDLFGWKGATLREKLFQQYDTRGKVRILNAFFVELVTNHSFLNQLIINASMDFILKSKGSFSLGQLVKHTGFTERHIERKFMECVGINPKKFGNIVRLNGFLKQLKEKTDGENLTAIAYEAGYSDQSHLIREFKKFTGMTPKAYMHKANKLTINFLQTITSDTA